MNNELWQQNAMQPRLPKENAWKRRSRQWWEPCHLSLWDWGFAKLSLFKKKDLTEVMSEVFTFKLFLCIILHYDAYTYWAIAIASKHSGRTRTQRSPANSRLFPKMIQRHSFTGSGMQQLVPYLLGDIHPLETDYTIYSEGYVHRI